MPKEQLTKIFGGENNNLPDVALYFEFDYWIRPNSILTDKEILTKSKTFSGEVWDLNEKLCSLILG